MREREREGERGRERVWPFGRGFWREAFEAGKRRRGKEEEVHKDITSHREKGGWGVGVRYAAKRWSTSCRPHRKTTIGQNNKNVEKREERHEGRERCALPRNLRGKEEKEAV